MYRRWSHRVLRGEEASAFFAQEWDEMLRANPHATVFQTAQWYQAWIGAAAKAEGAEPAILCVPSYGPAQAAIALQINHQHDGSPIIRPLTAPWADYHEAVGQVGNHEVVDALARALEDFAEAETYPLDLDEVVPQGLLASALRLLPASQGYSSSTEGIELTNEHHLERIFASKEHAIKWRRLQRLGSVSCRHHSNIADVLGRLPFFIEMHRQQWAGRDDAVAPFDGGVIDATFEAMVRHLAPRGMVVLTELMLDSRPIAMYFGFVFGARYLAYRTSFDTFYHHLSPGHAMLRQMIRDFRASGLREIDLMRGAYLYKRQYTNRSSRNLRFEMHASS